MRTHAPQSRVMAVVKANAYGHGLVASALALAEADAFAVARLEEAIALRAAGLTPPHRAARGRIRCDEQLAEAARHELELVVHQAEQLAMLERFGAARAWSLWLKIDTGMNRLGFRPEEFAAAWRRLVGAASPPRHAARAHPSGRRR